MSPKNHQRVTKYEDVLTGIAMNYHDEISSALIIAQNIDLSHSVIH